MKNISSVFKLIFFLVIGCMIAVAVFALLSKPQDPDTQAAQSVEQTVVAAVNDALTQTAVMTPAAVTEADIEGTVAARLNEQLTPTADPNLFPEADLQASGGIVAFMGSILNGIFAALRWVWNLFSFGGVWLQLCCCLLLPLGAVVALARESL